jgi:hypothetical protein
MKKCQKNLNDIFEKCIIYLNLLSILEIFCNCSQGITRQKVRINKADSPFHVIPAEAGHEVKLFSAIQKGRRYLFSAIL